MNAPENHRSARRTAEDVAEAGRFFRYMADYVGFTAADAGIIRRTRPIIAKYLPEIVSEFYTHLLRYPLTRKLFLRPDGTIDELPEPAHAPPALLHPGSADPKCA